MKRFYTEVATSRDASGVTVHLDGRPVRTPARRVLVLPSAALAEAVAEEWREQGETMDTQVMRLTRLATTVVDLMPARRGDAVEEAAEYAATDLLCYRAASPASLVQRQADAWQPWLDWAERQYDARLRARGGVMPVTQSRGGVAGAAGGGGAARRLAPGRAACGDHAHWARWSWGWRWSAVR